MARPPTAQTRRVRAALAKLQPEIRKAFEQAIQQAAGAVDQAALIELLESNQIERAVELLRLNRAIMFPLDEAIRTVFIAGGTMVAADLPRGVSGRFGFDGRHVRAEAWVREHVGNLIQGIEQEGIETTRRVIREGLEAGRSSRVVAREITGRKVGTRRVGGYLGLTSEQTDQVLRARSILSDPDQIRDYFVKDRKTGRMKPRYKLSDRRFDTRIKKAIAEGKALSGKDLDDVIEAHRSKALGARGRLVAKTESHTALAAGREEAYQQLTDNPEVETVTVRWQKSPRINDRPDHLAMDGTVITFGETFNFADARMKHPHDPAGGAKHVANCGCIAVYRARFRRD
jgi:hypothetical protein